MSSSPFPDQGRDVLLLHHVVRGPSLASQLACRCCEASRRFAARLPRIDTAISAGSLRLAAALILTVPLTATLGAEALGWSARAEGEAFAHAADARTHAGRRLEAVAASRDALETALRRPTIAQSMAMLADGLPTGATLHRVSRDPSGALTVVVETADPDMLRAALDQNSALSTLAEIAHDSAGTGSLRVTFRSFDL